MYAFIDAHRETYGVEPICRVLQIAPSGYYEHHAARADPARRSARRTQLRSVSAEQPSFSAMARIAAHCDSYSAWCS